MASSQMGPKQGSFILGQGIAASGEVPETGLPEFPRMELQEVKC